MKKKIKDFKKDLKLDNSLLKVDSNHSLSPKKDENHTNDNDINNEDNYEILFNNETNKLASPFDVHINATKVNFNEKGIEKRLEKIMPEKDHYLIGYIIKDKENYYSSNLTNEIGVFRDNNVNLLQVVHGDKEGFKIPKYIKKIGIKDGLNILSHNHTNGLVIPPQTDIGSMTLLQSKYSPIYSPNKIGLLFNKNLSKVMKLAIMKKWRN